MCEVLVLTAASDGCFDIVVLSEEPLWGEYSKLLKWMKSVWRYSATTRNWVSFGSTAPRT